MTSDQISYSTEAARPRIPSLRDSTIDLLTSAMIGDATDDGELSMMHWLAINAINDDLAAARPEPPVEGAPVALSRCPQCGTTQHALMDLIARRALAPSPEEGGE